MSIKGTLTLRNVDRSVTYGWATTHQQPGSQAHNLPTALSSSLTTTLSSSLTTTMSSSLTTTLSSRGAQRRRICSCFWDPKMQQESKLFVTSGWATTHQQPGSQPHNPPTALSSSLTTTLSSSLTTTLSSRGAQRRRICSCFWDPKMQRESKIIVTSGYATTHSEPRKSAFQLAPYS